MPRNGAGSNGRRDPPLPLARPRAPPPGGDRDQRDRTLRRAPAPASGGGERRTRAWGFVPRGGPTHGSPVPEVGRVPRTRGGGGLLRRVAPFGPRAGRAPGPRPALRPGPLPVGYGGGGRRRRRPPPRPPPPPRGPCRPRGG